MSYYEGRSYDEYKKQSGKTLKPYKQQTTKSKYPKKETKLLQYEKETDKLFKKKNKNKKRKNKKKAKNKHTKKAQKHSKHKFKSKQIAKQQQKINNVNNIKQQQDDNDIAQSKQVQPQSSTSMNEDNILKLQNEVEVKQTTEIEENQTKKLLINAKVIAASNCFEQNSIYLSPDKFITEDGLYMHKLYQLQFDTEPNMDQINQLTKKVHKLQLILKTIAAKMKLLQPKILHDSLLPSKKIEIESKYSTLSAQYSTHFREYHICLFQLQHKTEHNYNERIRTKKTKEEKDNFRKKIDSVYHISGRKQYSGPKGQKPYSHKISPNSTTPFITKLRQLKSLCKQPKKNNKNTTFNLLIDGYIRVFVGRTLSLIMTAQIRVIVQRYVGKIRVIDMDDEAMSISAVFPHDPLIPYQPEQYARWRYTRRMEQMIGGEIQPLFKNYVLDEEYDLNYLCDNLTNKHINPSYTVPDNVLQLLKIVLSSYNDRSDVKAERRSNDRSDVKAERRSTESTRYLCAYHFGDVVSHHSDDHDVKFDKLNKNMIHTVTGYLVQCIGIDRQLIISNNILYYICGYYEEYTDCYLKQSVDKMIKKLDCILLHKYIWEKDKMEYKVPNHIPYNIFCHQGLRNPFTFLCERYFDSSIRNVSSIMFEYTFNKLKPTHYLFGPAVINGGVIVMLIVLRQCLYVKHFPLIGVYYDDPKDVNYDNIPLFSRIPKEWTKYIHINIKRSFERANYFECYNREGQKQFTFTRKLLWFLRDYIMYKKRLMGNWRSRDPLYDETPAEFQNLFGIMCDMYYDLKMMFLPRLLVKLHEDLKIYCTAFINNAHANVCRKQLNGAKRILTKIENMEREIGPVINLIKIAFCNEFNGAMILQYTGELSTHFHSPNTSSATYFYQNIY